MVESLEAGIDAKGATIDDFRHADGARGSFQDRFLVHLREGEPCPRCGRPMRKLRAAGRGTYVCERCQPRPRAPAPLGPSRAVRARLEKLLERPGAVGLEQLAEAADRPLADEDLGEGHLPGAGPPARRGPSGSLARLISVVGARRARPAGPWPGGRSRTARWCTA